jgi:hypothetical protein
VCPNTQFTRILLYEIGIPSIFYIFSLEHAQAWLVLNPQRAESPFGTPLDVSTSAP